MPINPFMPEHIKGVSGGRTNYEIEYPMERRRK